MFRNHAVVYTKSEFLRFVKRKPRDGRVVGKKLTSKGKSSDCSRVDLSTEILQTEDLSMKNNTYNDYLLPNVLAMRFSHFLYRSFSAILLLSCLQNL